MKNVAPHLVLVLVGACSALPGCSSNEDVVPNQALDSGPVGDAASPTGLGSLPQTDPFASATLDPAWSVLNPQLASLTTRSGTLTLEMKAKAIWAGPNEAVHVWKRVTGNFRATATVRARSTSSPELPPRGPVRLGGLMARNPSSPPRQNYVHIVVGFAPTGLSVETKTTTDNATSYEAPAWPSADAELRICRVGQTFTLLKRPVGGDRWEVGATIERPEMPSELAVGPNVYAQYGAGGPPGDGGAPDAAGVDAGPDIGPDLSVLVGPVVFAAVTTSGDCSASDKVAP